MKKIITLTITFLLFVLVPVMQGWSQDRYIRCVPNTVSGILPAMTDSSGKIIMNFDSLPDFSLTFSPWQAVDKDGKATYGIQDHTFPHSGEAMAFIVFNPSQVNPSMSGDTAIQPHTGSKFAGCFSAQEPPNNDWLISPRVSLKYNGTFSFWVKSYTSQYGLEKFNVAVSVTDSTPSSFTVISGSNPLEAPTKWTKFSYDLSAYSNQQVYIAVNCVSNDAFLFMLDDMEVDPGSDTPALPSSIIQNFDSIADFSLDFSPWGTIDVNGGMTYAIQNVSFPNSGMPMAWINFNPTVLTNSPANMIAHSGTKFAACFSSMPPNNPNDKWLISPRLQLGVNSKMELWAMTYNSVYGAEKFNICVSTGGNTVSDFTVISKSGGEQAPDNWTKMTFDLSAYDGEKVYIGIQCITNDGFVFMLDDISINSVVGIENHPGDTDWQIYPNPSAGKILLEKHSGMEKDTRFILTDISGNILGDMSASSFTGEKIEMDLSGFSSGIYLLHIQNNHSSVIKKIVITH